MDDGLALFELQQALVKPALELCRGFNSVLDCAFYDVPALERDLAERQVSIDLDAGDNPEGAILVVDAAHAPFIRRFEDYEAFVGWHDGAAAKPATASITGVGSSARGSAAFAWDIAGALDEPVIAIVPGYGVADALQQALGGWFGFGLHNALQTKSKLQDMLALTAPEVAKVGRGLVGSVPGAAKVNTAPVFETGSGSSDVLHALLQRIPIRRLVGHSKGALAIGNALRSLDPAATAGLSIVTLGCPIAEEIATATYHQYLGRFDALGQLNAWNNRPTEWLATDHSTNTALPLSMNAATLV